MYNDALNKTEAFRDNVSDGLSLSREMLSVLQTSNLHQRVDVPELDSRKRNIAIVLNTGSRPEDVVGLGYPALFEPCHCESMEESILWWTDMESSCVKLLRGPASWDSVG